MRVLIVSDIHANSAALSAVPEGFDHVLCLGDLVDYGPDPEPCISWIRDHDAITVRGNHDQAVAERVSCRCNPAMREESEASREVMWKTLRPTEISYLGSLPLQISVALGGVRFHLVHAMPSDPLYTYLRPDQEERWAEKAEKIDADVLLVGHTHLPMILRFGRKFIVNPGSVGQPRDGDPRASFAIVDDGDPRLCRAAYDIESTIRSLESRNLPEPVLQRLAHLLFTGRLS